MNDERLLLPLDDHPGPAPRISSARATSIVDAALEQALDEGSLPLAARVAVEHSGVWARMRGPVRALSLAAGVLLLLAGGAAAAKLIAERFFQPDAKLAEPREPAAKQTPKRVAPPAKESELELDALPEVVLEPSAQEPRATRKSSTERASAPEDLLQNANRARSEGRFAEAAAIYAEVYERYPRSLSAYVAQIAAGSIELEHLGRPERARRLFLRALRSQPKGALDLEARQGLALSLRDLGEREQEAAALRSLIDAHPTRPAARRALIRLRELAQAEPAP